MANREAGLMQQAAEQDPRIRWLKPLVIGLSIVFFGGMILLVVLLATGTTRQRGTVGTAASTSTAPRSVTAEDLSLTLPRNSRISDVLSTGSRIVVRVRLADGTERLYAFDGETLQPRGSLTLEVER